MYTGYQLDLLAIECLPDWSKRKSMIGCSAETPKPHFVTKFTMDFHVQNCALSLLITDWPIVSCPNAYSDQPTTNPVW